MGVLTVISEPVAKPESDSRISEVQQGSFYIAAGPKPPVKRCGMLPDGK